jgi:hypothetical protein
MEKLTNQPNLFLINGGAVFYTCSAFELKEDRSFTAVGDRDPDRMIIRYSGYFQDVELPSFFDLGENSQLVLVPLNGLFNRKAFLIFIYSWSTKIVEKVRIHELIKFLAEPLEKMPWEATSF